MNRKGMVKANPPFQAPVWRRCAFFETPRCVLSNILWISLDNSEHDDNNNNDNTNDKGENDGKKRKA